MLFIPLFYRIRSYRILLKTKSSKRLRNIQRKILNNTLDNNVRSILGGNSGIGKDTALDLARRGARILLLCRDTNKGEIAAKSIRDQISSEIILQNHGRSCSGFKRFPNIDDGGEMGITFKPKLQVYCLDLASISSIRECTKTINKKESKIDILINNAGNYT